MYGRFCAEATPLDRGAADREVVLPARVRRVEAGKPLHNLLCLAIAYTIRDAGERVRPRWQIDDPEDGLRFKIQSVVRPSRRLIELRCVGGVQVTDLPTLQTGGFSSGFRVARLI